jgi:hypothetical protein
MIGEMHMRKNSPAEALVLFVKKPDGHCAVPRSKGHRCGESRMDGMQSRTVRS